MAAVAADDAARAALELRAANLVSGATITIFNEDLGVKDFMRWREEISGYIRSGGHDFAAALAHLGDIPVAPVYAAASVLLDTAAAAPTMTQPSIRQQAMLTIITQSLQPGGQSRTLIRNCVHASGTVAGAPQATQLLDTRCNTGAITVDNSAKSHSLFKKKEEWPLEVSAEAYLGFFNSIVSLAGEIGFNPQGNWAGTTNTLNMVGHLFSTAGCFNLVRDSKGCPLGHSQPAAHHRAPPRIFICYAGRNSCVGGVGCDA